MKQILSIFLVLGLFSFEQSANAKEATGSDILLLLTTTDYSRGYSRVYEERYSIHENGDVYFKGGFQRSYKTTVKLLDILDDEEVEDIKEKIEKVVDSGPKKKRVLDKCDQKPTEYFYYYARNPKTKKQESKKRKTKRLISLASGNRPCGVTTNYNRTKEREELVKLLEKIEKDN